MEQILELLSSRWLIHTDTALSYIPLLVAFLSGKSDKLSLFDQTAEDAKRAKPKALAFGQASTITEFELSDPGIPENSVAVIPVWGPIVPSKSMQLIDCIRQAQFNPNINSILFPVNSPGGTIFYLDILSGEISSTTKPTVAVVMNCCASAAMWITSAMDYRIATSPMDQVGSIGTMVSIMDFRGLLEKIGIKETQLYADKSILKNASVRSLFADQPNQQPIMDQINFVNEIFHKAIQDNLSISADSEVFSGAIYYAQQAISLKLINEINSLDYAIEYAYKQGLIYKGKSQFQSLKTTKS